MMTSTQIQWYDGYSQFAGYGLEEEEDGTLNVYRENGVCIGNAGNIELAIQMMQEDE